MRQFVYLYRNGSISKPVGLGSVMRAARARLIVGRGPWALRIDDEELGRFKRRRAALQGLRREAERGDVGTVYRLRTSERVVFQCREIRPAIEITDTNGNDKADRCWSAVKAEFPKVQFLGAYVCKRVAGTYTLSQHSYGNAVDFGAGSMDALYDIARWLVNRAAELDLEHVIVDDRIWTRGYSWSSYSGDRHYHVHVDYVPQYSGSCGVRGGRV